jgi:hypothetical protein
MVICHRASTVLLAASLHLAGQSLASLSGTVVDSSGGLMSNVRVTVVEPNANVRRTTITNAEGLFFLPLLPPGRYTATVVKPDFQITEVRDIVLNAEQHRTLTIEMRVGDVTTVINISAESMSTNTVDGSVGTVVNRDVVRRLPLNGRTFQNLITLAPGVVLTVAAGSEQGQFSVNGQRANANYFTVDGVSVNIGVPTGSLAGQPMSGSLPALTTGGGTNNLVSIDALQEFTITSSSSNAISGRMPGGQVSIVTRSGTNDLHAGLFDYFRNDVLDANDWFANQQSLRKAPMRQNDFGGTWGGPIRKNRTFFFLSYEGLRLRLPQTGVSFVPSLNERETAAAPLKPLLAAFPLPTGPDLGNGEAQFTAAYSNPSSLNATSGRLDENIGDHWRLFARYNYAPSENLTRWTSMLNRSFSSTQTLTLGATWAISSTVTHDLRFNWSRVSGGGDVSFDRFGGATPPTSTSLLPPFASLSNSAFFAGFPGGSFEAGTFAANLQRQINVVDTLSVTRSNHQLSLGFDYRYLFPQFGPVQYGVNYVFFTPEDVRTDRAQIQTSAQDRIGVTFQNLSIYGQDSWRVNSRLNLTYGLRWEFVPPPHGRNGKPLYTADNMNDPSQLRFAAAGTPLWETTYGNFAPRLGAAYDLRRRSSSDLVLRGGWGLYYDLGSGLVANTAARAPYARATDPFIGTFPEDAALLQRPPLSVNDNFVYGEFFDRHLKLPYTMQWNVSLEQSIEGKQAISAAYVGAAGRRLLRREQLPQLCDSDGNCQNQVPQFIAVNITRNTAESDYNALQLQYRRRLSNGLQALASYTWSKSLDTASEDSSNDLVPGVRINPEQNRAPSSFDVRHNFAIALSWEPQGLAGSRLVNHITKNWSFDTMFRAQSAKPADVTIIRNLGYGYYEFHPDQILGVPLYVSDPNVPGGRRINGIPNPSDPNQFGAFLIPEGSVQGTLGRNALRGFPSYQLDLSLRRSFSLNDRLSLLAGVEAFNLTNHPNFGDPTGLIAEISPFYPNPLFGQAAQMLGHALGGLNPLYQIGGPRSIQLLLRLQF